MDKINFSLRFVAKKKLALLIILICIAVLLEVASLASILPVFTVLINKDIDESSYYFKYFENLFDLEIFNFTPNLLFLVLFLYIFKTVYVYFIVYFQSKISLEIQLKFADRLLKLYQEQGYLSFLKSKSSELFRNVYSEVPLLVKFLILPVVIIITEIIIVITLLLFISFVNLNFLLTVFAILIFSSTSYFFYFSKRIKNWGEKRLQSDKFRVEFLQYNFDGFKEIKLTNKQKNFRDEYNNYNLISGTNNLFSSVLSQLPRYFLEILILSIVFAFIIINLFNENDLTDLIPVLAVFFGAFYRILPSINRIYQSVQSIKFGLPVFEKIYGEFKKIESRKKNNLEFNFKDMIEFKDIFFSYPDKKILLNNINFKIKKGECIGIVGESGSGKSTLINILIGLLSPTSGEIKVDHIKRDLNSDNWFKLISHIPQEIFLLNDSIKKNIAFGIKDELINDDRIKNIINEVKLNKLLENLPKGINTEVGDKGSNISGGEKQRIAIARALYKNTEIFVFDEATNSLDKENENSILKLIKSLKGTKTIIMISHNDSILDFTDKVLRIENNQIKD
tara:strand:- start:5205 stop:6899 length:1695 start_codon:yes stop_codon:yes gene_type:complete